MSTFYGKNAEAFKLLGIAPEFIFDPVLEIWRLFLTQVIRGHGIVPDRDLRLVPPSKLWDLGLQGPCARKQHVSHGQGVRPLTWQRNLSHLQPEIDRNSLFVLFCIYLSILLVLLHFCPDFSLPEILLFRGREKSTVGAWHAGSSRISWLRLALSTVFVSCTFRTFHDTFMKGNAPLESSLTLRS